MTTPSTRPHLALVLSLAAALPAYAADAPVVVEVHTNATTVQVGDVFQLDVVVTVSAPGEPEELVLPDLGGFEVVRQERAPTTSRTVVVNGQMSQSRSFGFSFFLRATSPGERTIGPGRARMAGHVSRTAPIVVTVVARAGGAKAGASSMLDPAARFKGREAPPIFVDARFDKDEAYVGEQVLFTVDVYATGYVDLDLRQLEPPKPEGFWLEVLDTPGRIRPTQRTIAGKSYLVYQALRVAMFPLEEGEHQIAPVTVLVLNAQGAWRRRQETRLVSDPVALVVRALPETGRPPGFPQGNVGHWQLRSEASAAEVPLGQPFTLKVIAGGEGHLEALELPKVAELLARARVFPPTTQQTKGVQQGRLHGEKVIELLVQPRRSGTFEVPSFTLPYFNPESGRYEEAKSAPLTVRVMKGDLDDGRASREVQKLTGGARPVMRNLTLPGDARPLYARPLYQASTTAVGALGVLAFAFGLSRARRRASLDAQTRARRRKRRRALDDAREQKDLAAAEHVLVDALAERFGEETRALPALELDGYLAKAKQLDAKARGELLHWLEAAQAARYAPKAGADKKALLDDAGRLLLALDEERP